MARPPLPSPRAAEPAVDQEHLEAMEELAAAAYGEVAITEVIRPAAVLGEHAARAVLFALTTRDACSGGEWIALPSSWTRYDRPWDSPNEPGSAELVGTMQVAYGMPTRYEITIYRATISVYGEQHGWDVVRLCDEALAYGGLSLASCPRASLSPPPRPFRMA